MIYSPIKWTGSKRTQASEIIKHFPKQINNYYEPFVGGGSIMLALLDSDIEVKKVHVSDIDENLIGMWTMIRDEPMKIWTAYSLHWSLFNKDKSHYYVMRRDFNTRKMPETFFFLMRVCVNGLVRYNSKGEFNSPSHHNRKGMDPDRLWKILDKAHTLVKKVKFSVKDFSKINTNAGDFIYCDPPYFHSKKDSMYKGFVDQSMFYEWLQKQQGDYAVSLGGKNDKGSLMSNVPQNLYTKHIQLKAGLCAYDNIRCIQNTVYDSLYIK